jgi:hypothetical protein
MYVILPLENVLSAGYPKKYPATSMSPDLLDTEVLLGIYRVLWQVPSGGIDPVRSGSNLTFTLLSYYTLIM